MSSSGFQAAGSATQTGSSSRLRNVVEYHKAAMIKYAKMLTRSHDLKVYFRGSEVYAMPGMIVLPDLNVLNRPNMGKEDVKKALDFLRVVKGYVQHECGHILKTQFGEMANAHYTGGTSLQAVCNAYEDGRMQRLMGREFSGIREDLNFMDNWLSKKWVEHIDNGRKLTDFEWVVQGTLVYLVSNGKYKEDPFWQRIPEDIRKFILKNRELHNRGLKASTTKRCFFSAKKFWRLLCKKFGKPADPSLQRVKVRVQRKKRSRTLVFASDPATGQLLEQETGFPVTVKGYGSKKEDLVSIINNELQTLTETLLQPPEYGRSDSVPYLVFSTDADTAGIPTTPDLYELKNRRERLAELDQKAASVFGMLSRKLQVVLQALHRSDTIGNKDAGDDLDYDVLGLLALGLTSRAFSIQEEHKSLRNTILELSIDTSGSMSGSRLELARIAVLIAAKALDMVGVKFSVTSWHSGTRYTAQQNYAACDARFRRMYARFSSNHIAIIKNYDEPWLQVRHRVFDMQAQNCNNDGESIKYNVQRLLARPEQRKCLWVFTDGIPNPASASIEPADRHAEYLREIIKDARTTAGIDLTCFGILAPKARDFYEYATSSGERRGFVNIDREQDLVKAVCQELPVLLAKK